MRLSPVPLLIVLVAAPALAAPPAGRPLTLDDALQLARGQSRDLAAARARLDQAAVGIAQAWVALLPTASAQGKYTHNYKEVTLDLLAQQQGTFALVDILKATSGNAVQNGVLNAYEQALAAATTGPPIIIQRAEQLDFVLATTIPLVVPSAYPALAAARRTVDAARATFEVTQAALLLSVAQGFYAAAGSDEILTARRHAITVAQQTVDNARARLEAGVVNRVEVTRAELALLRAEQSSVEAEDTQVQAYRSLATLIQLKEPFYVVPPAESPGDEATVDELADGALHLRPEFAQFRKNHDLYMSQMSSARWRWAPTLSGFGNLRAFNYPGFSGDQYAWALGLQVDWVLYDGGARDAQYRLAAAQQRENDLRDAQLRDTVKDDIYNARRGVATKRRALGTAQRSLELSKETLELVRVQHDAGTATQLDLLQAQDGLVGAEVALAQARFDLLLSALQLRRTAGLFP